MEALSQIQPPTIPPLNDGVWTQVGPKVKALAKKSDPSPNVNSKKTEGINKFEMHAIFTRLENADLGKSAKKRSP